MKTVMRRMEGNAANAGAEWQMKQYSKWNSLWQFISMQSISYTIEQKVFIREESMRSNMVRNIIQQYYIINSISFPLLLRLARRTERLSRSRDANMPSRTISINIHSSFIKSKHTAGIITTLVYSTPTNAIQNYHNIIIPLKRLGTLPHFIFVYQHSSS